MSNTNKTPRAKTRITRPLAWFFALAAAMLLGQMLGNPAGASGDVRRQTSQQQFKSAAARNEPVLKEISATLKQIDQRLARMEQRWNDRNRSDSK